MGVNGIYGLSGSGLDIESMVKVGMMSKQNEYDKMAQKYTKNEWTKAAYLDISNSISTFNTTKLSDYKMSASMNAKTAVSSDSSIKVTANASAANMAHKVEVTSLASNAYLIGTAGVTRKDSSAATDSIKIADAIFKMGTTYDDATKSGDVYYGNDNNEYNGTFQGDNVAFKFLVTDGTKAVADLTADEIKKYTIEYTYDDLLGDNAKTFNDLVKDINNMGLNVKASYDNVNDRFSFYNTEGGLNNTVTFTLDAVGTGNTTWSDDPTDPNAIATLNTRDFLNGLHLMQSREGNVYSGRETSKDWTYDTATKTFTNADGTKTYNTTTGKYYDQSGNEITDSTLLPSTAPSAIEFNVSENVDSSKTLSGTDGTVKIDGVGYTTTDNKVTVNGLTYDTAAAAKGTTSLVSISQDVDAIVDKVKSFVEDYNKILSGLYEKYDEKPDSNYKPLTQSQKDAMKEEQVTKWEEKAKAGILYHDKTLQRIILDMRSAISESITLEDGSQISAYNIGISTTGLKGQLKLDEDKLRSALAKDSDAVYNVFAKLDANDMNNSAKSGIAQRLGDVFTTATKNIKSRAGSSSDVTEDSDLNNLLRNLQTKMSNFKKMMNAFEDALYKKYDKMESALARLGTQMNYIMGSSGQ